MCPFWLTRLTRRPGAVACTVCLSLAYCFLLCYLIGYRERQQREINQVQESFKIECVVSDPAGTRTSGLNMPGGYIDRVTYEVYPLASHVKELRLSREFLYEISGSEERQNLTEGIKEPKEPDIIKALNSPVGEELLSKEYGGNVRFYDWYGKDADKEEKLKDFFEEEMAYCLIPSSMAPGIEKDLSGEMEENSSEVYQLTLRVKENEGREMKEITLTVAGEYLFDGTQIYIPWGYAVSLMQEISGYISCDSMRFLVKDNTRLGELAEAAKDVFITVNPAAVNSEGYALTVYDELYRTTLSALEQDVARTRILIPLLLLLSLGAGMLASFLSAGNEGKVYGLMQSLGTGIGNTFLAALAEQMLPALAGGAAGAISCIVIFGGRGESAADITICYFLCYLFGCSLAVKGILQRGLMQLLKEE